MSTRAAHAPAEARTLQRGRKSTQRARLLAGMVATANHDGYANANVSKIIAAAGVSRPTFYEHFADKDDCFLAALADIHERLLEEIRRAVQEHPPHEALQASLTALLQFAGAQPAEAMFLTSQAMAAGPAALDARDQGIGEIERVIEAAHAQVPDARPVPDVSARVLTGGVYRLLASQLRRGSPRLGRALEDLTTWLQSYAQPIGEQRWATLQPLDTGTAPAGSALAPLAAPSRLPPGRPGLSKEDVAANHRARILYAAAQLAEQKGYNASTIADITRLAGVDGRAFYAAFADKQDAFMAVHELGVQQVMGATAGAFFTGSTWPERMWEAGRALTGFLQSNPMIAHVGFVEAYAVGPGAVQRVEDSHVTFTIFLQEGYQQQPRRTPPPALALEAIITSIFEIIYIEVRQQSSPRLEGMLGHMAFLALAPVPGGQRGEPVHRGAGRTAAKDLTALALAAGQDCRGPARWPRVRRRAPDAASSVSNLGTQAALVATLPHERRGGLRQLSCPHRARRRGERCTRRVQRELPIRPAGQAKGSVRGMHPRAARVLAIRHRWRVTGR